MVDSHCTKVNGTQYICIVFKPRTFSSLLAVATYWRSYLERTGPLGSNLAPGDFRMWLVYPANGNIYD